MEKVVRGGVCLVLILGLSLGCRSKITKERVGQVSLDHTTDAEVVKLFGRPKHDITVVRGSESSKLYSYAKVYSGGIGPVEVTNYYHLTIETRDGIAVGYLYARSDDDPTRFDTKKADQIIEGQTTRSGLMALLGPPSGMAEANSLLPDYKHVQGKGDTQILAWANAEPAAGILIAGQLQLTLLIVEVDRNQRVVTKAIETTTVGNKFD
jgi:hypothetical protein